MDFTITLTDAEYKALSHVAYDPKEWIENAVYERCRIAMDEIVSQEVQKIISEGGQISGTRDDIVLAAQIITAKEKTDNGIL